MNLLISSQFSFTKTFTVFAVVLGLIFSAIYCNILPLEQNQELFYDLLPPPPPHPPPWEKSLNHISGAGDGDSGCFSLSGTIALRTEYSMVGGVEGKSLRSFLSLHVWNHHLRSWARLIMVPVISGTIHKVKIPPHHLSMGKEGSLHLSNIVTCN